MPIETELLERGTDYAQVPYPYLPGKVGNAQLSELANPCEDRETTLNCFCNVTMDFLLRIYNDPKAPDSPFLQTLRKVTDPAPRKIYCWNRYRDRDDYLDVSTSIEGLVECLPFECDGLEVLKLYAKYLPPAVRESLTPTPVLWDHPSIGSTPHYRYARLTPEGMIRFYMTEEKYKAGVAVTMKPGRYLHKYHNIPNGPLLDKLAASTGNPFKLVWFEEAKDIEHAYKITAPHGYSCMRGGITSKYHPARVYGRYKDLDTDFRLAVLVSAQEPEKFLARSIVSKLTKHFVRVYGHVQSGPHETALLNMLVAEGCIKAEKYGNDTHKHHRVRRVWHNKTSKMLCMPYIDGEKAFDMGTDELYCQVHTYGEFKSSGDFIRGKYPLDRSAHEDDDDENHMTCDGCDGDYHGDDVRGTGHGEYYCYSCYNERYTTCPGCGVHDVSRDDMSDVTTARLRRIHPYTINVDEQAVCEDCFREAFRCEGDDTHYSENTPVYETADGEAWALPHYLDQGLWLNGHLFDVSNAPDVTTDENYNPITTITLTIANLNVNLRAADRRSYLRPLRPWTCQHSVLHRHHLHAAPQA